MAQTLEAATTPPVTPLSDPQLIVMEDGKPRYAMIDYALYLALQEIIEEWYADQRAAAAYQEWLQDPSTARPWAEIKAEMVTAGLIDG